jgi:hypothetical protein
MNIAGIDLPSHNDGQALPAELVDHREHPVRLPSYLRSATKSYAITWFGYSDQSDQPPVIGPPVS